MAEQVKIHFLAQKSDSRPRTQMMSFLIVTLVCSSILLGKKLGALFRA